MKKYVLILVLCCLGWSSLTFSASTQPPRYATFENTISLSPGLFEWSRFDSDGHIIGSHGLNWGLGYSKKTYLNSVETRQWNRFWHWGTLLAVIPYVGVGTEFTGKKLYFEMGTIYIVPYVSFGIHF